MSDAVQQLSGNEQEEDTPEDGGSKLTVRADVMGMPAGLSSHLVPCSFLIYFVATAALVS